MKIFKKKNKIINTFRIKCPRCHEGDLFETGSFSFAKPFDMYKQCPNCQLNYWPEPGYYYGAMFLSYIFTAWFCLGFIAFFHWVLGWSTGASFALLILVCIIGFVYLFRLARSMWLNINVKYEPDKAKTVKEKGVSF